MRLPKWLFVVVEDDMLRNLNLKHDEGVSITFGKAIDWVMTEHLRAITRFKSFMPIRAKKYNWPMIAWIIPSLHVNYFNFDMRKKFIRSLRLAADNHNLAVIPLKQAWDHRDSKNFMVKFQRYTPIGLTCLWTSIDRAIKYADYKCIRNYGKALHELFTNDLTEEDEMVQSREEIRNARLYSEDFIPNFFANHRINDQNDQHRNRRLPEPRRRLDYSDYY